MHTVRELAAALRSGSTTSERLIEETLTRVAAHRRAGGTAYLAVDEDGALAAARASDAARAAGRVPSLLAGLPVSIKDLFDIKGQTTAAGSKVLAQAPPAAADAPIVARLREAGAVLVGRTNMVEFAFSGLGLNPHYGTPVNPVAPDRVPGGSTSGGAVSVTGDMAVIALGSDTGGSIRIPASCCGIVGFKPTASRVSTVGMLPLSTTLDSCGPLGATVDCCAIADAVLSGQPLDDTVASLSSLRLAVVEDFVGDGVDGEVAAAFDRALAALSNAGATVQRAPFPELKELPAINAGGGFSAAESWAWHRELLGRHADQYDPRVAARIERGRQQTAADYVDLLAARRRLVAIAEQRLSSFDAWLMPTLPVVPPRLDDLKKDDGYFAINALVLRNPSVINFLDGCALSLPCPVGGALPIGLSICGLHGRDARILQIGRGVEAALKA